MIKVQEAIVVEGRYDKNTLSQIVDAPILETSGFSIMKDKDQLALLRKVAQKRGLIVFTDSDGAGFVIRNFLKSAIPETSLKHAYIPDVLGKERRKKTPGKEGKLGVEGMTPEIILQAGGHDTQCQRLLREDPPQQPLHADKGGIFHQHAGFKGDIHLALGLDVHDFRRMQLAFQVGQFSIDLCQQVFVAHGGGLLSDAMIRTLYYTP